MSYRIVRYYQNERQPSERVQGGLTLEEAKAHCKSPLASSKTNQTPEGRARTRAKGEWFEGFTEE